MSKLLSSENRSRDLIVNIEKYRFPKMVSCSILLWFLVHVFSRDKKDIGRFEVHKTKIIFLIHVYYLFKNSDSVL